MPVEQIGEKETLELLRPELDKLIREKVDGEVDFEKTWQIQRLSKADAYNRYLTNIAPYFSATTGDFGYSPIGTPNVPGTEQSQSRGIYDYNVDIVRSYGDKYVGVLGTRPFHNCKASPDDPQSEVDRKAARQKDLAAQWLRGKWKIRKKQIELFNHQWESGTVYAYLNHVADKDVFGEIEEPQFNPKTVELEPGGYRCQSCGRKSPEPAMTETVDEAYNPVPQMACPACGAAMSDVNREDPITTEIPEPAAPKRYPGSGVILKFTTGAYVTIPFDTPPDELGKAPYLLYEYEENQGTLLSLFGETLREHVDDQGNFTKGGKTAAQQQAVTARASFSSLTATPRFGINNRWTYSRYWLNANMFQHVKDEALRSVLQDKFAEGILLHKVEGYTVKIEADSIGKHWVAIEPKPGKFVYHDPVCWGILGQQEIINDLWNMIVLTLEKGLPLAGVDPDVFDVEAITSRPHQINELIEAKAGQGQRLSGAIQTFPKAEFPDQIPAILQALEGTVQVGTGLLPAVWGGAEGAKTATEDRNRLNQALMQLSVAGEYATQAFAAIFEVATKLLCEHAPKNFAVATGNTSEMLDFEAMRAGNAHFEGEAGIPRSFGELRDQMNAIITENPNLAQSMGLGLAINIPVVRDYLLTGMGELKIPGENERAKVLETIQQLIEQEPVQVPGPMGVETKPSIMPEPWVDDPILDAELVHQWIIDEPGRKLKANPARVANYQNVVAYGLELVKMGQPPMLPMGAPGAPGAPGPEGAPPDNSQQQLPPGLSAPGQPQPTPEQVGA